MGRIRNTWALMGASWNLLKQDKEILLFPLLSGISCLLILLTFAVPIGFSMGEGEELAISDTVMYMGLFLFYLCNYFVITFFNSAIVACAVIRMNGGDPTVKDGFEAAVKRLPLIFGWALVAATVGFVLRIIEERAEFVGKIVAGLLGAVWTMTSFLVIPILVIEEKTPLDALKESAKYLKKNWGEQLVGNFSFGLVFFLLALPGVALFFVGLFVGGSSGSMALMIMTLAMAVVYFIVLSLVQSALQTIFQAALFVYLKDDMDPEGFPTDLLANAVQAK